MTTEKILLTELSAARQSLPAGEFQLSDALAKLAAWYCEHRQPSRAHPLIHELWELQRQRLGEFGQQTLRILSWLATVLVTSGKSNLAETLLRDFNDRSQSDVSITPEDRAAVLNQLAELYYQQSKLDDAHKICLQALSVLRHDLEQSGSGNAMATPQLCRARNNFGALLVSRGEYREAQRFFVQNLREAQKRLTPDNPALAAQLANLAAVLRLRGRLAQAERLTIRAVRRCQRATGSFHPLVAQGLANLGSYRLQAGRSKSAESLFRKALKTWKRLHPPGHPQIDKCRRHLAEALLALGKHSPAERLLEKTRISLERRHPVDETQLAQTLCSLGFVYLGLGRLANAERVLGQTLEMQERRLGPQNVQLAQTWNGLGGLNAARGNHEAARTAHCKALKLAEGHFGPNHPELAKTLIWIGEAALAEGRLDDAKIALERALNLRKTHLGVNHPLVAEVLTRCAYLALAEKRPSRALSIGARATAIYNQSDFRITERPPLALADALAVAAEASRRLNRFRGAQSLTADELKLREQVVGTDHVSLLPGLKRMAAVCLERDLHSEAERALRRGLAIAEKTVSATHDESIHFAENLGRLYVANSRFDDAKQWMERAVEMCQRCHGDQSDQVADTMLRCATLLRSAHRDLDADAYERRAIDLRNRNCHVLL